MSGNGQKELLAALSGETLSAGRRDRAVRNAGRAASTRRSGARWGLSFVPEERLGRGAVPALDLADNALLTGSGHGMVRGGFIRRGAVREFSRRVIERFKVKCRSEQAAASSLSGGNLQKYIVGRETLLDPKVIVVAQPTWGVDIGASMLIRQALIDLRDRGVAVLVVSEELDELFMICDRIAVIAQGRLSPAVPAAQTSVEQVGSWMSGLFEQAAGEVARSLRMLKLEPRQEPSRAMAYASPLLAVALTLRLRLCAVLAAGEGSGAGVRRVLRASRCRRATVWASCS